MGKKKELRRRIEGLDTDNACAFVENEALRDELAHTINRVIMLSEENDRLNDEVADLETVIVGLNRAVFGIGTTKSVELYNSAEWPS